jgi:hypothetical protein
MGPPRSVPSNLASEKPPSWQHLKALEDSLKSLTVFADAARSALEVERTSKLPNGRSNKDVQRAFPGWYAPGGALTILEEHLGDTWNSLESLKTFVATQGSQLSTGYWEVPRETDGSSGVWQPSAQENDFVPSGDVIDHQGL